MRSVNTKGRSYLLNEVGLIYSMRSVLHLNDVALTLITVALTLNKVGHTLNKVGLTLNKVGHKTRF